jgi:SET domain-containing protein 6
VLRSPTVAKNDIAADTVLFTIPRDAIICTATSSLREKIPGIFDLDADDDIESNTENGESSGSSQDSWTLLILVMIYEHLQGGGSRWKPYLDVLPSAFDTPMFWSNVEVSELQASALATKIGKEEADRMITTKIIPVVRAHEDVFFPSGSHKLDDEQLLRLAHHMGSAIMAYAFDLEDDENNDATGDEDGDGWVEDKEGRTMLGMVPMADMLNADAEFNAHINHGEEALTATALRDIKAGEEILNYYGPLPNSELLRRYGYVTPKHSRYDVVELPWDLVEMEVKTRLIGEISPSAWEKARQRVRSDDDFEESFVLERVGEEPDPTGQLHGDAVFSSLPDELGAQFKSLVKAAKKIGNSRLAAELLEDKDRRKELYLEVVLGALRAREQQYATSLEEDEMILGGNLSRAQEMAVVVRMGEKKLLREAQAWIQHQLSSAKHASSSASDEPENKRSVKRRRL